MKTALAAITATICAFSLAWADPQITDALDVNAADVGQPQSSTVSTGRAISLQREAYQKGIAPSPGTAFVPTKPDYDSIKVAQDYARVAARDAANPVSIISFSPLDPKTIDEITEDLNILSLILAKSLEQALGDQSEENEYKLGIPMLLKTSGRSVEAQYIQGFGAILNLRVPFPLVEPGSERDNPQSPPNSNSEWEEARRALTDPSQTYSELWRTMPGENGEHYDSKLVETLKSRVVEVLKNVSNLRHLKATECVVVTIYGQPSVLPFVSGVVVNGTRPESDAKPIAQAAGDASGIPAPPSAKIPSRRGIGSYAPNAASIKMSMPARRTVMTIRTTKENADALAASKINGQQFVRAAEVTTYLGPVVANAVTTNYRIRGTEPRKSEVPHP
ncbi:MAG TPA: hypothetical protein VFE51_01605 [Verrucomicrobiae bacterium]|nr:hypothetical protein [Verrucomicrobiae bacterium]